MIITECPDISIGDLFPTDQPPRTKGCHLSEVILSMMVDLDPERYGRSDSSTQMMNLVAGIAFERALERVMAQMHQSRYPGIIRPGEFMLDGIIGTPDGLDCNADPPRLYEYKFTKKSARYSLTDKRFLYWILQLKSYLKMMGLQHARLIALFVNGEYEKGPNLGDMQLRGFDLAFSRRELEEHWWMVVNRARREGRIP